MYIVRTYPSSTHKFNKKYLVPFGQRAKIIFPHNAVILAMFSKCILKWTGSQIKTEAFMLNAQWSMFGCSVNWIINNKTANECNLVCYCVRWENFFISHGLPHAESIESDSCRRLNLKILNIISTQKHTNWLLFQRRKLKCSVHVIIIRNVKCFFLPYLTLSLFNAGNLPILHIQWDSFWISFLLQYF